MSASSDNSASSSIGKSGGGTLLGNYSSDSNSNSPPNSPVPENQDDHDLLSIFGDGDCGEPLRPQRLLIDFTPDETDTDFLQKKCCAFWDMINSHPELDKWIVYPDKPAFTKEKKDETESSSAPMPSSSPETSIDKTAVSTLSLVANKGIANHSFAPKMPASKCSLGSREYHENQQSTSQKKRCSKTRVCTCARVCEPCVSKVGSSRARRTEVQDMVHDMMEWDKKHPKTMEPPGHSPSLTNAVLQRRLEPL